ncbi:MAG: hypothetical protein HQL16_04735, partial [Candidatus Omnitrophica bacterium]|nr:hypothetical protein [Candidatus Omnitrophota bacterium]
QYVEAFKKGAFNLIKEEKDTLTQEILPRKYFSGGMDFGQALPLVLAFTHDASMLSQGSLGRIMVVRTDFQIVNRPVQALRGGKEISFPGTLDIENLPTNELVRRHYSNIGTLEEDIVSFFVKLTGWLSGSAQEELVRELFINLYHESENENRREAIRADVSLMQSARGVKILKLVLFQPFISSERWAKIRKNSKLTSRELTNFRVRGEKNLLEDGGVGFFSYGRLVAEGRRVALKYKREENGGMTMTLWMRADSAMKAYDAGRLAKDKRTPWDILLKDPVFQKRYGEGKAQSFIPESIRDYVVRSRKYEKNINIFLSEFVLTTLMHAYKDRHDPVFNEFDLGSFDYQIFMMDLIAFMDQANKDNARAQEARAFLWKLGETAFRHHIKYFGKSDRSVFRKVFPLADQLPPKSAYPLADLAAGTRAAQYMARLTTPVVMLDNSYFIEAYLNEARRYFGKENLVTVRRGDVREAQNLLRGPYQHIRISHIDDYVGKLPDSFYQALLRKVVLGGSVAVEYPLQAKSRQSLAALFRITKNDDAWRPADKGRYQGLNGKPTDYVVFAKERAPSDHAMATPPEPTMQGYMEDIKEAENQGLIKHGLGGMENFKFSHFEKVYDKNVRSFSKNGRVLLERLLKEQGEEKAINILELGPGSGMASSQMSQMAPHALIDTVSLVPLAPHFRWKSGYYQVLQWATEFAAKKEGARVKQLLSEQNGILSLDIALALQRNGYPVFDISDKPYIRQQYIQSFGWKIEIENERKYSLIYDDNGGFVYSAIEGYSLEELYEKTLNMLDDNGVFYLEADVGRLESFAMLRSTAMAEKFLFITFPRYGMMIVPRNSRIGQQFLREIGPSLQGTEGFWYSLKDKDAQEVLAMLHSVTDSAMANKGGIDLNTDKIDLQTKSDSELSIKFNMDPVMLKRVENAQGLTPVITSILPLDDLLQFLGV